MPLRSFTTEQQRAISTRDVSIALSAGAGCGKTSVLTERFISHLERVTPESDAAELRQLIAITFTEAAAREMRSRIREACYQRLQAAASDEEQDHWLRLLREIDTARISTIHSFCASLLRAHSAEAGLDPTFGVLDQGDADVLQFHVIDDVLREQLTALDAETLDLAAAFGLSRLKQQIALLLNERHHDYFHHWQSATPDEMVDRWQAWHEREAFPNALREIAAAAPTDEMLELLRDISPEKAGFAEACDVLLALLPKLAAAQLTERDLATVRDFARVQTICTVDDWPTAEAFNRYRDVCTRLRDLIDALQARPIERQVAVEAAKLGLGLLRLTAKVVAGYTGRKAALGQLDFDDLLSKAYVLVIDPENARLRERLADDLRLLLVDEFQDTDQLQVNLVKAICGPGIDAGRLFFVGDFKQSIYRFRGAAPKVFRDLREQLGEQGRLPLNVNFRSQPAVLDFINALFVDAFGHDGQRYEPLSPSRTQITASSCVEFLWTLTPDKNTHAKGAAEAARREEARAIARRLRALIDSQTREQPIVDRDSGQPRSVQLGDVAILFRALSDVHLYEEALREYELPYYLVGGHAFYAQQEIYDVLNLLRAVASSADELSLAGALRSPLFSLQDETLFWLVETAGSLHEGLLAERPPAQLSPDECAKVAAAAETIRALRAMKDRVPIATLLGEALDRTGYDAVLLAEFLGDRKLANLQKLLERARAADSGVADLDGFVTQLAQFIARQPKEALAATLPETADVIRLMTIHHAKGLEFPLVIVPDLDRPPHIATPSAALHPDLGPLVPWPNDDHERVSTGMTLFAAIERHEELEERQRLFYVACTRAADYLILSSSLAAHEQPKSDWMKLLAGRFQLAGGELIGRLPPGYDRPQVRVTSDPQTDRGRVGKPRGPDLLRLLAEARQLAADGGGTIPLSAGPVAVDAAARRRFSFSQLTGELIPDGASASQTDESSEFSASAVRGRDFGGLVHEVLARIEFGRKFDLAEWCRHLASQYVAVDHETAGGRAVEMLERFVASPRGKKLARARSLHREVEFLLAWPPAGMGEVESERAPSISLASGASAELRPQPPRRHFFRGYIDCLYQDVDGGWHLVDFKTNLVSAADVPHVSRHYQLQLFVYAIAAERVLGESPVELVLHLLHPGAEQVFDWNSDVRSHAIDRIHQAITRTMDRSLQRPV
jgi:ATP-dependent helicase/nuclease subunit A